MAYSFYLDSTLLPITPESLRIKIRNQNKTISLINEGEMSFLKLPGLSEVQFEAVFPQNSYPFANGEVKTADFYLSKLEQLKIGKKHFQFIVSRTTPQGKLLFDTNMTVSLEDYEITEDAKELGMDADEVLRLTQITGLAEMFADREFSEAWEVDMLDESDFVDEMFEEADE